MFSATIIDNSFDYYHDRICDNDNSKIFFWLKTNYLIIVNYFLDINYYKFSFFMLNSYS